MTAQDPALTQALDRLTLQVNRDNVLAAHKAFRDHAKNLDRYLNSLAQDATMGRCGGDPVSRDAVSAASFGGKIAALLEVHRAHQRELTIAADHLQAIARDYGYTEEAIQRSMSPLRMTE